MKEIINPYDKEQNMCFGCSVKNPIGLSLRFTESEESLFAKWTPTENYQGYPNILHGGIIATLLDETGGWCVSVKIGSAGVTSEMKTKYIAPVYMNKGDLTITATIRERKEKSAIVYCSLHDGQDKLCAEAVIDFFIYPLEVAVRRFRYPGRDAFYGNL
jgi:uncharacterized protein (TIGR00369 family)